MMKIINSLNLSFLVAGVLGLSLMSPSSAEAVSLRITVENASTSPDVFFSPFWLGLHDGSFDTFTPGEEASLPLEIVAEDGIIGLELTQPEFLPFLEVVIAGGATLPDPADTIAALFSALEPDGIQQLAFANIFGFPAGSDFSFTVDVDPSIHKTLSYASMIVPSHDGFVADIDPISIFSDTGVFLPQTIEILARDVYDAGTEVNAEDLSQTPITFDPPSLFFGAVRQGIPENGVIQKHPLLKEAGQGGFLDLPRFANSDFTRAPDATVARIKVELVPEPLTLLGAGTAVGLGAFFKRKLNQNQSQ